MATAPEPPITFPSATLPPNLDDVKDIFISATAHKLYRFGQRVTLKEVIDQDDEPVGRKRTGSHSIRGAASLTDLINSGLLVPGENKVHISYKGHNVAATLTTDGGIEYQGRRYQSATAFSIFFKRTITPSKLGDDGWKSVLYDGRPLEHYRHVYLERKAAAAGSDGDDQDQEDGDDDNDVDSINEDDIEFADDSDSGGNDDDDDDPLPEFEFNVDGDTTTPGLNVPAASSAGTMPMDLDGLALPSTAPTTTTTAAPALISDRKPPRPPKSANKTPATGKKASGGSAAKQRAPKSSGKGKSKAGAAAAGGGMAMDAAIAAAPQTGAAVPEDNWICCDRCEQWRVVPADKWAAVQADTRDKWFCEYSTWDLTAMPPFTPACPAELA